MIVDQKINGRDAAVVYLDEFFNPVLVDDAKLVKILFADGEVTFLSPNKKKG